MNLSARDVNSLLDLAKDGVTLLARAAVVLIDSRQRSMPQENPDNKLYREHQAARQQPWGSGRHPGEAPAHSRYPDEPTVAQQRHDQESGPQRRRPGPFIEDVLPNGF